jgi:hypothetical protein
MDAWRRASLSICPPWSRTRSGWRFTTAMSRPPLVSKASTPPPTCTFWQTRRAGEIDFVCGPRIAPDLVEVKYQRSPDLRRAAAIPRAFPARPVVVATADRLERRQGYALVPAALLLWALG